jgi:thiamine-phosphate pyrophosphorylase
VAVEGLHVLIDPDRVPEDGLPAFLDAIIRGGATVVQVRIKQGSTRAALQYIGSVRARTAGRLTLIINDRVDWALASGADGVHLGQDDMPLHIARQIAPGLILGASAGNAAEVRAVAALQPDYVGIGPVFVTPSKADAGEPLGLSGMRALVRALPRSIVPVAIGGIEPGNARGVWETGVRGLAVIHAVTTARDPEQAVRGLLSGSHL